MRRITIATFITVASLLICVIVPIYLQLRENKAFDISGASHTRVDKVADMVTEFPVLKHMARSALEKDGEISNMEYLKISVLHAALLQAKRQEEAQAKLRSVL